MGFFRRNNHNLGSAAFDGGASIPLSDGRVLWTTADAWDGSSLTAQNMLNSNQYMAYQNSIIIQTTTDNWDSNVRNVYVPRVGQWGWSQQVLHLPQGVYGEGSHAWPEAGIEIGNKVYVHANEAGNGASDPQPGKTSDW